MPNTPNGVYGNRPWQTSPLAAYPPQEYLGPFASNQERLVTQAMAVGTMSAAEVQEFVRPNLPQVELFPDKYGYSTKEYGITDIIQQRGRGNDLSRDYMSQGGNNEINSTSRNTLGQV